VDKRAQAKQRIESKKFMDDEWNHDEYGECTPRAVVPPDKITEEDYEYFQYIEKEKLEREKRARLQEKQKLARFNEKRREILWSNNDTLLDPKADPHRDIDLDLDHDLKSNDPSIAAPTPASAPAPASAPVVVEAKDEDGDENEDESKDDERGPLPVKSPTSRLTGAAIKKVAKLNPKPKVLTLSQTGVKRTCPIQAPAPSAPGEPQPKIAIGANTAKSLIEKVCTYESSDDEA
jgi:hypothetical protein